jgi:hypothetical protein
MQVLRLRKQTTHTTSITLHTVFMQCQVLGWSSFAFHSNDLRSTLDKNNTEKMYSTRIYNTGIWHLVWTFYGLQNTVYTNCSFLRQRSARWVPWKDRSGNKLYQLLVNSSHSIFYSLTSVLEQYCPLLTLTSLKTYCFICLYLIRYLKESINNQPMCTLHIINY